MLCSLINMSAYVSLSITKGSEETQGKVEGETGGKPAADREEPGPKEFSLHEVKVSFKYLSLCKNFLIYVRKI